MDTRGSNLTFDIKITPVGSISPHAKISLDDCALFDDIIIQPLTVSKQCRLAPGPHKITVELLDKQPNDIDQALQIDSVKLNTIQDNRFIWQAIYTPRYPEPWYSQQIQAGNQPLRNLQSTNYLGWNGIWCLEFTAPVFTWIHQIQSLGWIYD